LRQSTCKAADREDWYRDFVARCRARGQEPVLLANGNLVKEGLDLVELPTLVETGIEYRLNDLRQRDRRSWRLIQDKSVRVVFLYYEGSWQETALQLIAAKLKAALMVEGNLAEGLAAMDVDDGNLMDALMKAVANGRSKAVEWSSMKIAAVEKAVTVQESLLPEVPRVEQTEVEVMGVTPEPHVDRATSNVPYLGRPKPAFPGAKKIARCPNDSGLGSGTKFFSTTRGEAPQCG
jgi:hypothetical protein